MRRTEWSLAVLLLALPFHYAPAAAGTILPGLYLTNAVVHTNGHARFEIRTPSSAEPFSLLVAFHLDRWSFVTPLNANTNRYIIESPGPASDFEQIFLRALRLGHEVHYLRFQHNRFTNIRLSNGLPLLSFPLPSASWQVRVTQVNTTNAPLAADVTLQGPPGSGLANLVVERIEENSHEFTFETPPSSSLPLPAAGDWSFMNGTNPATVIRGDPGNASHRVLMVPRVTAANGQLSELEWFYQNPTTGAVLDGVPDFVRSADVKIFGGDYDLYGRNDNRIYDATSSSSRSFTNIVFDPPLEWTNGLIMLDFDDFQGNSHRIQYSFGNRYEVYGGLSFSTTEPDWFEKGYAPRAHGYTFLGSATNTATFTGAHSVYIVRVPKHNLVRVDTVEGSAGNYYPTFITGNTPGFGNIGGTPDSQFASVGDAGDTGRGFQTGGFFVISASATPTTSLRVIVALD